ncbi:MFS transporter [Sphaerotilus sp.]|uniref:MFS transporter n=1 Tax=Sphaerotilus sp. TaxID=2093942 RepID=UPI00286E941A|nr:MFS transporter [Sphaerotilus sp.]
MQSTAIPSTVTPPEVVRARVAVALLFIANGMGFASWVSRIPAVRAPLGLSEGELGSALLCMAIGGLIAFGPTGHGVQRWGARRVTLWVSLAYGALLVLPTLAPNGWTLGLALALFGAANGAMDVAMNALAVEVEQRVGRPIMSSLHGLWSAGGLAGALLGGWLAHQSVWPGWHLAGVGVAAIGAVLWARHWLGGHIGEVHAAEEEAPRWARPEAALAGLGAIIFAAFLIEGAMADWSAVYLNGALGTTQAEATLGYSVFALAMMAMRFAGDRLVLHWGAVPMLRTLNALAGVGLAAALVSGSLAVTLPAFALTGLAIGTVAPLVFSAAAQRSRRGAGQGIAAMATLGYSGFLIGPPVIGWLAQATSLQVALGVLVLLAGVIAALAEHLAPAVAAAPAVSVDEAPAQRL